MLPSMADMIKLIWWAVIGLFRSRASLEAEILTLRHQLNVLRRKSPKRLAFSNVDRLIFAGLYQIAPRVGTLDDHGAGDGYWLASRRFPLVLAMEVATADRRWR